MLYKPDWRNFTMNVYMSTLVFSWLILASLVMLKRIICRHMSLQINAQIARKMERYSSSPSPGFLDYLQWLRNLCKCYRTKKIMSKETCSSSFWRGVGKIFDLAVWHWFEVSATKLKFLAWRKVSHVEYLLLCQDSAMIRFHLPWSC